MGKRSNRVYTQEFKKQAATLAIEMGATRAAKQLGVPMSVVAKWKKSELENRPRPSNLKADLEAENKRLLAENAEQKKIITILKSAAAFFSRDHLK
jgi:transposase